MYVTFLVVGVREGRCYNSPMGMLHKRVTMRRMILALSIGSTVFALVLLTAIFGVTSRRQIRQESMAESAQTLERMQTEIDRRIHRVFTEMTTIYTETDLVGNMRYRAPSGRNLTQFYWIAWRLARTRFDSDDGLEAMYIYDVTDQLVSCYRRSVMQFPQDIYKTDMDENLGQLENYLHSDDSNLFITGYYNRTTNRDVMRFVLKLHNYDARRATYGYLICDFDSSIMTDIMQKYIGDQGVAVWLQPIAARPIAKTGDRQGEIEANYHTVWESVAKIQAQEELDQSPLLRADYQGCYMSAHLNSEYGLNAFMLTSQSLALATQGLLIRTLLVIMLLMIALTGFVAALITRNLSQPVEEMRDTIIQIKNGNTALRVAPVGCSDELEVLGTEFNDMLDRIQNMIKEEYEAKTLMERTEYKALQAQINPHFLYNTLDTMSGIANAQNCVLVSGLCQSLSAIFRYSLDISDSLSTMQKEMAHVRNYLYVMDVRTGNSIKYDFEIDADTLQDEVPRITIQPIVENAVSHGLRNVRRKDKHLLIRAKHSGDKKELLVITVQDNGAGMDANEMNAELSRADLHRVEIGRSIGVLNVNARIKQVFGPEYGVHIESTIGEGTSVTITLPAKEEVAAVEQEI